jgi:indole-3-glycerol phosphate synthase
MISSHLTSFATKRLACVESIDRQIWPAESLKEFGFYQQKRPSLREALLNPLPRINVLVEIKKASPSLGELSTCSALQMCQSYAHAGAKALSVLVDQPNFKGHPQDLFDCVAAYPHLPFLFKDFVASEYQVRLAKALGASSVLLMSQLLEFSELQKLYDLAIDLGLEPFVECHELGELERALELKPPIIGINSRDFKDKNLAIDLATAPQLLRSLGRDWPAETALVAQSGISTSDQLESLIGACPQGLPHAVQIGSSLSQAGTLPRWLVD